MRPAAIVLSLVFLIVLGSCKPSEMSHSKAILGAVLIDGLGGPPLSDSVVIIAGGRIRAAGAGSTVPIPAESDRINGSGKFVVPGLIDISAALKMISATTSDDEIQAMRAAGRPVM